jgi:NAD(P)H-nitrite reductase large subunit
VIGGEPHPSCNRILLSSVLTDERTLAEIGIQPAVQVFGRRQSQNLRRTQAAGG